MNQERQQSVAERSPDGSLDHAVDQALGGLDGLDGLSVHEHVEVYAAVDRALRERLAGAEG